MEIRITWSAVAGGSTLVGTGNRLGLDLLLLELESLLCSLEEKEEGKEEEIPALTPLGMAWASI